MYAFIKVISEYINDQFILFDYYLYTRYLCTLGLSASRTSARDYRVYSIYDSYWHKKFTDGNDLETVMNSF